SAVSSAGHVICRGNLAQQYLIVNGTRTDLPAGSYGTRAVDAAGDVVYTTGTSQPMRLHEGVSAPLAGYPGATTYANLAANDNGEVVGSAQVSGVTRGLIWQDGTPALLDELAPSGSGWSLTTPLQITTSGKIFGRGTLNGASRYFLLDLGSCSIRSDALSVASPLVGATGALATQQFAGGCGPTGIDWTMPDRLKPGSAAFSQGPFGSARATYVYPASWHLDLFLKDGANRVVDRSECDTSPGALVQWRWTVGPSAKVLNAPSPGCAPGMDVRALGVYDVVAKRYSRSGPSAPWTYSRVMISGKVEAKDWVVAAIGDSNGSGEGNPPFFYPRCNRSEASHQFKTARYLETQDKRSSVTLIWTSCSGARTHHLTSVRYPGTRPATPALPPQVDQVQAILIRPDGSTPRKVDMVMLSIGVNDLSFGAVAKWCAFHPATPRSPKVQCQNMHVKHSGNVTTNEYTFVKGGRKDPTIAQWVQRFANRLPARYAALSTALTTPMDPRTPGSLGVAPGKVFITTYPDFSTDENGKACSTVNFAASVFRWNTGTWRWWGVASRRLNAKIRTTGGFFGVSSMKDNAFNGHGYCAGRFPTYANSWIRGVLNARRSGDTAGPLHPTRPGHELEADGLAHPMCKRLYGNFVCTGRWRDN
ncbi:MAG: hypothetical protein IT200_17005, partial [Thermoleophilia bacterium]|nr:hypothetical protein [Thermoleophilia bacterium]